MPTLRQQLKARRDAYLERIAVFDVVRCDEQYDNRVASVRGFLAGGDDIPPECEARGVKPERRRLPQFIPKEEADAAFLRLTEPKKAEPSDSADWDHFLAVRDGHRIEVAGGYGLYRLTAQLVRATEYFKKGVEIKPAQIFELSVSELPDLEGTIDTVPRAWQLLEICGSHHEVLKKCYQHLLDAAGPMMSEVTGLQTLLPETIQHWLHKFGRDHRVTDGQTCPETPLPRDRVFDEDCPCQRKPPPPEKKDKQDSTQPPPPPTIELATEASRDAMLAAFNDEAALQWLIKDFQTIELKPEAVAQILLWLRDRWEEVPPEYQFWIAGPKWRARHPGMARPYPGDEEGKPALSRHQDQWKQHLFRFNQLWQVPRFFLLLSQKTVAQVCVEIVKALWPDDDHAPYNDTALEDSGITREGYLAAADRTMGRDDCPFRLVALLRAPEGYIRVFDKPGVEDDTGANRLSRPTWDRISAFYWNHVIVHSTIGHILAMVDTADFHIAEHIRFLGLFRPGGRYRPYRNGEPEDAAYERFISALIPSWVIEFMTAALLRVKYWLDDRPLERPNEQEMTYWSENHQILFASSEFILPLFFPSETFAYINQSASWHRERALPRLRQWLDHRLQFGFSELNSGVYYNQHLPALFNLVDFVPDDAGSSEEEKKVHREIRKKALLVLDLMIFDIVRRVCQGSFVAASGRQYWGSKRNGWSVSVLDTIELLTGLVGDVWGVGESSAVALATSRYLDEIPEVLLAIAHDTAAPRIDHSRSSINLSESKDYGIDPESSSGIVFWWGNGAYFTDETFSTTQSWSYRWSLRSSGPFKLFEWIDYAAWRLLYAVLNFFVSGVGIAVGAIEQNLVTYLFNYLAHLFNVAFGRGGKGPEAATATGFQAMGFPIDLLQGAMLAPIVLRRIVDVVLSVVDVLVSIATTVLKEIGVLDENDDRVRMARTAVEQEIRALAIQFNAGSVINRQHFYGWRSRDAMLSSLIDNARGATAFQTEPCIATLGLNVTVFTGQRPKLKDESDFSSTLQTGIEGYKSGAARYGNDSEVIESQVDIWGAGESAPEIGRVAAPLASSEMFGDDGPGYWFGNLSAPLVVQQENVAICIYWPNELQRDMSPAETHAHWPFDHFDEIVTKEVAGYRWLFGRRDRRFPPRTPCEPIGRRPTAAKPFAEGKRRDEKGAGSGYIALFSARGMKTNPDSPYGHREVIAEGHNNVWIMVVGDRATYGNFDAFQEDVLNIMLAVDLEQPACTMTMPIPGGKANQQMGKVLEVSWAEGGKFDGKKIETGKWPRFKWERSTLPARAPSISFYGLRVDDVLVTSKEDPGKGQVDWDDHHWRIEAKVRAWEPKTDADGRVTWHETTAVLYVEHDFSTLDQPKREIPKTDAEALHPRFVGTLSIATHVLAEQHPPKIIKSLLGQSFRKERATFRLRR